MSARKTYDGFITKLEDNHVFVFGSNLQGFHGGGAAGFASFGIAGNNWRNIDYHKWPDGKKGKWNVKGVGKGFQEGTEGKSYALPTVTHAGARRSIPLSEIRKNISELYEFAKANSHLEFFIAYTCANTNLNGYTDEEMASVFSQPNIPLNIIFNKQFHTLVCYNSGF